MVTLLNSPRKKIIQEVLIIKEIIIKRAVLKWSCYPGNWGLRPGHSRQ